MQHSHLQNPQYIVQSLLTCNTVTYKNLRTYTNLSWCATQSLTKTWVHRPISFVDRNCDISRHPIWEQYLCEEKRPLDTPFTMSETGTFSCTFDTVTHHKQTSEFFSATCKFSWLYNLKLTKSPIALYWKQMSKRWWMIINDNQWSLSRAKAWTQNSHW